MDGAAAIGSDAPVRTVALRRGEVAPAALEKLKGVAEGFDAVFAGTMLSELLAPVTGSGLAGSGPGASVVQGMLEQTLSDHLSKAGGFGIGRMVMEAVKPLLATQQVDVRELEGNAAFRAADGGTK